MAKIINMYILKTTCILFLKGQPKVPDFFHESVEGMMVIIFPLRVRSIIKTASDGVELHSHGKKTGTFVYPLRMLLTISLFLNSGVLQWEIHNK